MEIAVYVHETRTRVRYVETDQMGVVYHANYLVYFELGRTEYMREIGIPYAAVEKEGLFFAVSEAQCTFRASARYDDLVVVRTRVSELTAVRLTFAYEVRNEGGRLLADGSTVLVCLSREGRPTRIPDTLAAHIAAAESRTSAKDAR
jgi:acyl-CoA thioester hydrolase